MFHPLSLFYMLFNNVKSSWNGFVILDEGTNTKISENTEVSEIPESACADLKNEGYRWEHLDEIHQMLTQDILNQNEKKNTRLSSLHFTSMHKDNYLNQQNVRLG
jgi:hypothetical protein